MINLKTLFAAIGIILLLLTATWFSFEKIALYVKINSPLPKHWQSVHLNNGDIYYGKVSGTFGKTLNLSSPYFLEKVNKVDGAQESKESATSSTFKFSGTPKISEQKYILVQHEKNMLINRQNILFIQEVSEDEEVFKHLR